MMTSTSFGMFAPHRHLRRATLAGAALCVILGCGGKDSLTEAEFCEKKAENECTGVATRCGATAAACQAVRIAACQAFAAAQQAAPSSAIARPFRPDRTEACLNKAKEVYAKAVIVPADRAALDDVCARVYSGSKKSTDAEKSCTLNYECDVNLVCDPGFLLCAPKAVATSGFCNNPGETCPAGQFCAATTPRTCMARLGEGKDCDLATPCLETLRCNGGVCVARVAALGTCASDSDCAPSAPYCDHYNGDICTGGFTPSTLAPECIAAFGAGTSTGTGGAGGAAP